MTPEEAYYSARRQGSSDETRKIACQSSYWGYSYAREVDWGPHEDTRAAACLDPFNAYRYAYHVDTGPHDDTRAAVRQDSFWIYYYARDIDQFLHPESFRTLIPVWLARSREQLEFD